MFAAVPIAHQPCGAKGVQLSPPRDGSAIATASAITHDEHRRQHELEAGRDPQAERVRAQHHRVHREPDGGSHCGSRAGEIGDVVAADQSNRGTAEEHGDDEPAAGDGRGRIAEPLADVSADSARDGVANPERREHDRERRRDDHQRPHAMIDAAPAASAASAGTSSTPGPISAPT